MRNQDSKINQDKCKPERQTCLWKAKRDENMRREDNKQIHSTFEIIYV